VSRTKQEVVTEFRCAEIMDAARKVFASKGFNATTMDDVAEHAGIAKGTLYLYFRSKREIFVAALVQGIRQLSKDTERRVEAASGVLGKIDAFVRTRVEYFESNRDFFLIYHSEIGDLLVHPAKQDGDMADLYLDQARLLEAVLTAGASNGEVRELRAAATAFTICDMTRGVIVQRLLGWSKATLEEDLQHVIGLIWRGISV
jgi:AcrR family transcriptional regulator